MSSRILITAGPTREKIDPVRFISNYSTGHFGYEIAGEARRRGLSVTLVSGPTALARPRGVKFIGVESGREMLRAVSKEFPMCGYLIMAAAVSDWRVKGAAKSKLKKPLRRMRLELAENPDILKTVTREKGNRVVVGFALETDHLERNALKKLQSRKIDMIIANKLERHSNIFGDRCVEILILDRFGRQTRVRRESKRNLAKIILDKVLSFKIN